MNINTVSMKQLRESFPDIRERLEAGEELLLIYRSQPLAEIKPVGKETRKVPRKRDYAKMIEKLAGGFQLGANLTPNKLNKIYDQQYGKMLS